MIGTAAALIGSAVIGAGASALSASKNSKAIKQSTAAETAANAQALAAQERARSENLALQQPIYNAGLPAIQARNALLGLGGPQASGQQTLPAAQPNALAFYQGDNPDSTGGTFGVGMEPAYGRIGNGSGLRLPGVISGYGGGTFDTDGTQVTVGTQGQPAPQGNPQANAFDMFRNSTGYQFRLGEGARQGNAAFAGAGTFRSGARDKALLEYGQNFASNEFGNYFGMLGEQQNLTTGAANAMSGVNTTYANNAGNLAVANGQTLANAAVARANNSNALIGSIGNAAGGILGYYGGLRR